MAFTNLFGVRSPGDELCEGDMVIGGKFPSVGLLGLLLMMSVQLRYTIS